MYSGRRSAGAPRRIHGGGAASVHGGDIEDVGAGAGGLLGLPGGTQESLERAGAVHPQPYRQEHREHRAHHEDGEAAPLEASERRPHVPTLRYGSMGAVELSVTVLSMGRPSPLLAKSQVTVTVTVPPAWKAAAGWP